MSESPCGLEALKRRVARIEGRRALAPAAPYPLAADRPVAIAGALVELLAPDPEQLAAVAGLAAMLDTGGPVLWLRPQSAERRIGRLSGAGLAALGLDPARLLLGVLADDAALLRAAGDAAACPALSLLILEWWGKPLDLTVTRRLALRAERSGVAMLLLRQGAEAPGAATQRWAVTGAPSAALAARSPGFPALALELQRSKAGQSGWKGRLEWRPDERAFRSLPAVAGVELPLAPLGTVVPFSTPGFSRGAARGFAAGRARG
jgi:protein ImuA